MAGELFKKAAAYRKKHPGLSMPEAVKAVSKGKAAPATKKHKPAKVGRAKTKRITKTAPARKVKIKIRKGVNPVFSIGGISMAKLEKEMAHIAALEAQILSHQAQLREKGLTMKEKAGIRKEIAKYKHQVASSKKYVTQLKKGI